MSRFFVGSFMIFQLKSFGCGFVNVLAQQKCKSTWKKSVTELHTTELLRENFFLRAHAVLSGDVKFYL